jgi:hypothetical protein
MIRLEPYLIDVFSYLYDLLASISKIKRLMNKQFANLLSQVLKLVGKYALKNTRTISLVDL